MDVIYPYRSTPDDLELRYSLRSLVNLPHDRVIIAGDRPGFVGGAMTCVEVDRVADRYQSSAANILAGCKASEAEEVVAMHDDIFVLHPWAFQHENRGTIAEYLKSGHAHGKYRAAVETTRDILTTLGVEEPLFFGLHTPTVYRREALMDLIREFQGRTVLLRTLYHNLHPKPSVRAADVKVYYWPTRKAPVVGEVLSIADAVAAQPTFRRWIAEKFPAPSRYEDQTGEEVAA